MSQDSWQSEYYRLDMANKEIPNHLATNLVDRGFNWDVTTREDLAKEFFSVGFTPYQIGQMLQLSPAEVVTAVARIPKWLSQALTMHVQGLTALEISKELGVSRSGLYYHFHKRRIVPNTDVPASITTRQQKAILRAHAKGDNAAMIARRMGLSYDQVRYAIHQGAPVGV